MGATRRRDYRSPVIEWFKAHPDEPFSVDAVAVAVGVDRRLIGSLLPAIVRFNPDLGIGRAAAGWYKYTAPNGTAPTAEQPPLSAPRPAPVPAPVQEVVPLSPPPDVPTEKVLVIVHDQGDRLLCQRGRDTYEAFLLQRPGT